MSYIYLHFATAAEADDCVAKYVDPSSRRIDGEDSPQTFIAKIPESYYAKLSDADRRKVKYHRHFEIEGVLGTLAP